MDQEAIKNSLQYGNIAISGGGVVLLVTALQVLGQHGDELLSIRQETRDLRVSEEQQNILLQAKVAAVEAKMMTLERDCDNTKRLLRDPRARPDSWTRTDDETQMREHQEQMKLWIKDYLTKGKE